VKAATSKFNPIRLGLGKKPCGAHPLNAFHSSRGQQQSSSTPAGARRRVLRICIQSLAGPSWGAAFPRVRFHLCFHLSFPASFLSTHKLRVRFPFSGYRPSPTLPPTHPTTRVRHRHHHRPLLALLPPHPRPTTLLVRRWCHLAPVIRGFPAPPRRTIPFLLWPRPYPRPSHSQLARPSLGKAFGPQGTCTGVVVFVCWSGGDG
jgi:hypothetical protein